MPLHIFEPRYRLLARRSIDQKRPFGIVLIRNGNEVGENATPFDVGTEARVVGESPLPDGRSYIVARGERRFAIESLIPDVEPYLVGRVRYLAEPEGDEAAARVSEAIDALATYLLAVLAVTDDHRADRALADEMRTVPPVDVAYRIAGTLAVDPSERQTLLELASAADRLAQETRILRRETELLRDLLVRQRARGERAGLN